MNRVAGLATRGGYVVERRAVARSGYAARPDDLAELNALIATMRDVPREHVASMADVFHFLRRVTGRLAKIADRLEVVAPAPNVTPRERLPSCGTVDPRAVAAGIFKTTAKREQLRTVSDRSGRRVRVVERAVGQLRLPL